MSSHMYKPILGSWGTVQREGSHVFKHLHLITIASLTVILTEEKLSTHLVCFSELYQKCQAVGVGEQDNAGMEPESPTCKAHAPGTLSYRPSLHFIHLYFKTLQNTRTYSYSKQRKYKLLST